MILSLQESGKSKDYQALLQQAETASVEGGQLDVVCEQLQALVRELRPASSTLKEAGTAQQAPSCCQWGLLCASYCLPEYSGVTVMISVQLMELCRYVHGVEDTQAGALYERYKAVVKELVLS